MISNNRLLIMLGQAMVAKFDELTHEVRQINSGIGRTNQLLTQTNSHVTRISRGMHNMRAAVTQYTQSLRQSANAARQGAQNQQTWLQRLRESKGSADGLASTIKRAVTAYLSIQGAKAVTNISDEYVNTLARLNLVNDGLQTTEELQNKIFAAANRARGSYTDMAAVVGRLGLLASDAFGSTDEVIAFTELMQKAFRISGASTMEQQAGMYQLTQAMAAGRLQGDEFRSIMENAPMLAQAIADFTGKSKGELKEMSAEGTITADIIKGALFSAADEIERKFGQMPRTFSDIWNSVKNSMLQEFGPAIERISAMLNDPSMQNSMRSLGRTIADAAVMAVKLMDIIGKVSEFVRSNWTVIEPIIWGVVAAIGAWTVAQWALNIALAANPIGLIIMAAAALIGLITAIVVWIVKLWKTNDEFAANLLRAWNKILNWFDQVPIFFARVGIGIQTAFWNARAEVLQTMEDLVNGVIDRINWLIERLNSIKGVSLEAIQHVEFAATAATQAEAIRQAGEEAIRQMEEKAAQKAAEREQKVLDFLEDRAAKRAREQAEKEAAAADEYGGYDYSQWYQDPKLNSVDEVKKIRDTVDVSSEDLKVMRDLAEMKAIQNFVTLTPTVNVTTGPIAQTVDVDEVIAKIVEGATAEIEASARGVYG
jgi:tape measure domain-containing protein